MTKRYLCMCWGHVEPIVLAGPFEDGPDDSVPEEEVIKALKEVNEDRDLLFGMTVHENAARFWTFSDEYIDDMREKAGLNVCP